MKEKKVEEGRREGSWGPFNLGGTPEVMGETPRPSL